MAKCPLISEPGNAVDCKEDACQLWVSYITYQNEDPAGECALKVCALSYLGLRAAVA